MSIKFNLKLDEAQFAAVRSAVAGVKNGYESVMKNAINRTLSTVQTQAVARLANKMNLTSGNIKGDFSIQKATISKIGGYVKAKGKPMELYYFVGWSKTPHGIKIKIYKDSAQKTIDRAFVSYTKKSKNQIRRRTLQNYWGDTRKPKKPYLKYGALPKQYKNGQRISNSGSQDYRGPIEVLRGPRIEDVLVKPEIFDPVTIQAQHLFVQRVDEEVTELFRKLETTGKI